MAKKTDVKNAVASTYARMFGPTGTALEEDPPGRLRRAAGGE